LAISFSYKNKNFDENLNLKESEQNPFISLFLILSLFLPTNIHCSLIILELVEKIRIEKLFKKENQFFLVNHPNCLSALTQIDHVFLTKSTLIDPSCYKMVGAIIKENYYSIEEEKLNTLKAKASPMLIPPKRKEFRLLIEKIAETGYLFLLRKKKRIV